MNFPHFPSLFRTLAVTAFFFSFIPSFAGHNHPPPHRQITLDTVTLSTGITMEYAEKGQGNGHVVIFLHGYLDSWFSFSTIMDGLPNRYHSYSLSQRGFGESDTPLTGYDIQSYADDVIAFLDHFNIHRVSLVGHSMGSVIAQRIAIDHPDRIKELVLVGSGVDMTTNAVLQAFEEIAASLSDPIDQDFIDELMAGIAVNPIDPEFLEKLNAETSKVPAHVWQEALAGLQAVNYADELHLISAPTLIIWGTADEIFLYEEQTFLNDTIPNSSLLLYEGSGHGVQWEFPQQFTEDLAAFLR